MQPLPAYGDPPALLILRWTRHYMRCVENAHRAEAQAAATREPYLKATAREGYHVYRSMADTYQVCANQLAMAIFGRYVRLPRNWGAPS